MPVKKLINANKISIILDADYCIYSILFNIMEELSIQDFVKNAAPFTHQS